MEWGWADTIARLLKPMVKLPGPFNNPEILSMPVSLLQQISAQIPLPHPWPDIIQSLSQIGPNYTVGQAVNLFLAHGILKILAFMAVFLAAKIAVEIIASLTSALLRFSGIGPLDKLAGLVLGLAIGITSIIIIMTILVPLQVPLTLLGADGLIGTLERGLSGSYLISRYGPLVHGLGLIPSILPEFNSQFLFKYLPSGSGTEI